MSSLLEFSGSDEEFKETFVQTFQISQPDTFGSAVTFNLKKEGDKIPVTKQNRQVNYYLLKYSFFKISLIKFSIFVLTNLLCVSFTNV